MNRKSLKALLNNKSDISWIKSKCQDNKNIKWVYVCPFLKKDWEIGISENGYWCIGYGDHIHEIIEEKEGFFFVVLLDSTFEEVYQTIIAGLRQADLPNNVIFTFPFDEILLSAIRIPSSWRHKAHSWISNGYPETERMILALSNNDKQDPVYLRWRKNRFRNIFDN